MNRSAPLAIAASLSLLSTPAIAQEAAADPTPVEAPAATVPAAPTDPTPVVEVAPASEPTVETTSAPAAIEPTAARTTRASRGPTSAATAAPAPSRATPVAAPVNAPPAPEPATPAAALDAPITEPSADTIEPTTVVTDNGLDALTFGGILGLLVLGGGVTALARRRRKVPTTHVEPTAVAPRQEPIPAFVSNERSAFAWGQREPVREERTAIAGESWIERARRGPTPENPSLSLKKRLKRAAFFERREREVAAGSARPVTAQAGLPERMSAAAGSTMPSRTHDRVLQPA